MKKIQYHTTLY